MIYLEKTEITICLGSSCFARGNRNLVEVVKQFIRDNKLEDRVFFHGNHCFDKCIDGPVIKINDKVYTGIEESKVIGILEKHFYKL